MFNGMGFAFGKRGTAGAPAPAPVDLSQGLVAHYLLNNNADDSFGTYDGTANGGVDFQGDVAKFDGVNDYINSTALATTLSAQSQGTISFFANIVDTSIVNVLWTAHNSSLYQYIYCRINAGKLQLLLATASGITQYSLEGSTTLINNTSYHFVVQSNGSSIKMFVNGIEQTVTILSGTNTGGWFSQISAINFDISRLILNNGANIYYNGIKNISNFRIYNEAKDQTFIDALYAEGYYPKPLPLPTTNGLVAYYPLTGTAEDAWGAGGNESGTEYNGVAFVSDVDRGSVASFDGVNDFIQYGDADNKFRTQAHSYGGWVKAERGTQLEFIFCNHTWGSGAGSTNNGGSTIYISSQGYLTACYYMLNNETYTNSLGQEWTSYGAFVQRQLPTETNTWMHLFITINDNHMDFYINGVLYGSVTTVQSIRWNINNYDYYTIGARKRDVSGIDYYFDGMISEFRHYDNALTADDVLNIFNNTNPTELDLLLYSPLTIESRATDMWVAYDGVENGGLTYVDDAEFGSVANFDGVNDALTLSTPKTNQQGAISFWFKVADANAVNVLWSYSDISDTDYIYCRVYLNKLNLLLGKAGGFGTQYIAETTLTISNNVWYHVIIQADGINNPKVFIDTVEYTLTATSGSLTSEWFGDIIDGDTFNIGLLQISTGTYYSGVKNTRLLREYNRPLSQQEITDIYNYEKNFRHIDIDDGLVVYYPLKKNSLDNYKNQLDITIGTPTYDGNCAIHDGTTADILKYGYVTALQLNEHSFGGWVNLDSGSMFDSAEQSIFQNQARLSSSGSTSNEGSEISYYMGNFYAKFLVLNNETYTTSLGSQITSYAIFAAQVDGLVAHSTWYHVFCVIKTNYIELYVNGVLVCYTTSVQSIRWNTSTSVYGNVAIGGRASDASVLQVPTKGKTARARFIGKSITAEQVQAIYNTEKGDFGL